MSNFRSLVGFASAAIFAASIVGAPVSAQEAITTSVTKACTKELQAYCKGVTPGEGHVAACLYAYEDQLSTSCTIAVYKGVADLDKALHNLGVYAKACSADLMQYCGNTEPGHGRLYQCISKNKATLTNDCRAALKKSEPDMRKLGIVQ